MNKDRIRYRVESALPFSLHTGIMQGKIRPSTKEGEVKKYARGKNKVKWDRNKYKELFKKYSDKPNPYRIYLELDGTLVTDADVQVPSEINNFLKDEGYVVDNYLAGYARKADKPLDNPIKIGKIIQRSKAAKSEHLKRVFDEDPQRKAQSSNFMIVVSRHPTDILGASTDRGWTSCFRLGTLDEKGVGKVTEGLWKDKSTWGINWHLTIADIEQGGLVAYLIDTKKQRISAEGKRGTEGKKRLDATARISIRPFIAENGESILWHSGVVYGDAPPSFVRTVEKWLRKIQKFTQPLYNISPEVYVDAGKGIHLNLDYLEGLKPVDIANQLPALLEKVSGVNVFNAIMSNQELSGKVKNTLAAFMAVIRQDIETLLEPKALVKKLTSPDFVNPAMSDPKFFRLTKFGDFLSAADYQLGTSYEGELRKPTSDYYDVLMQVRDRTTMMDYFARKPVDATFKFHEKGVPVNLPYSFGLAVLSERMTEADAVTWINDMLAEAEKEKNDPEKYVEKVITNMTRVLNFSSNTGPFFGSDKSSRILNPAVIRTLAGWGRFKVLLENLNKKYKP